MKQISEKLGSAVSSMFSLRGDMASYSEIENTMISGAKFQGTNAWILILAILIASVGLNLNSTAVIIGAMLISPLMGGITCIAFGLATNDLKLAWWSTLRLSLQVLISLLTSTLYFAISPITEPSQELLARTSPTIWDVLIAICGGLAGIIGQTRKEKSNVIPGVAIATALMPPLCTAGYGLANRNMSYFGGAMYLFFINAFFICVTAFIVLKYLRVPQYKELSQKALKKIHRWIALITIITMIPSLYFAYTLVAEQIESSKIDSYLNNEFQFESTQIVQKDVDISGKTIEIALIGDKISTDDINLLKDKLRDYGLGNFELKLTQTTFEGGVTTQEIEEMYANAEATLTEKVSALAAQKENEDLKDENERLVQENQTLKKQIDAERERQIDSQQLAGELSAINSKITGCTGSYCEVYLNSSSNSKSGIVVTVLVTKSLSEEELTTVKNWLIQRLNNEQITVFQQNVKNYTDSGSNETVKQEDAE